MTKSLKNWLFLCIALLCFNSVFAKVAAFPNTITVSELPREAQQTLALIKQHGPFPHEKDGAIFGNYEGVLPQRKRGYYHEFTVKTPHTRNRGARRIITGGDLAAPREYYYTDNHYATFKRITE
ncbi:MAG: ribonuclease [Herminiimonas sp.]|nr:ribonuclease [Herminiimonas sp.]